VLFVRCREKALQCLNHLVTNALVHVPDCLEYLSRLHTPEVFKFCAIPQVRQPATKTPSRLSLSIKDSSGRADPSFMYAHDQTNR
jgi:hypothetical protein